MMTGRTVRWATLVLINSVVLLVGLVGLELLFGNWLTENKLNRLNIVRNVTLSYDLGSLYKSSNTTIEYSRDKYGFRGRFQKPQQIDILTVGGSTTDQRYITDGETWQDMLQDNLQAAGRDLVVANAGIDGQSTYGHIKNFEWWFPYVPGLKPKYILFYVGVNDLYLDEGNAYDLLLKVDRDRSLRQLLREKSAVYYIIQTLYGVYLAELKQNIGHRSVRFSELHWTTEPSQNNYDAVLGPRLRGYGARLEVLVERTRKLGAVPIFVTQPGREYRYRDGRLEGFKELKNFHGLQVNGLDYYFMMKKLDEVAKSVSLKHQLPFIDLAQEQSWEDDDFYDFRHMTPKGAKKVGALIFRGLKDIL